MNTTSKNPVSIDTMQPIEEIAAKSSLMMKSAPRISPATAREIFAKRGLKLKNAPAAQARVRSFGAQPGSATTIQSPASIAELARALRNDVDLLFYHVYNQIEYYPTYGLQKGSLGCLIDGLGNPWDQAALLVDLLREAGYTANFVFGDLDLSNDEIAHWLGTDSSNIFIAASVLTNGGIPNEPYWTGSAWRITLSHIWVKVEIDSSDYVLDPSYKSYVNVNGIDLADAMEYNQTNLLDAADSGATHGTSDLWIQNVNESGIQSELTNYASNLVDWIKTNNPTASMDEIVGGRKIVEIHTPIRQTSLPYQTGSLTDWSSIPNEYRTTLQFEYSVAGIDETFYSDEIYGKRMTVFFNGSNEPELRLDGNLIDTGSAQTSGTWNSALVAIVHPYPVTWFDESVFIRINAPYTGGGADYYLIGTAFGATRKGMVDYHSRKMAIADALGATEFSDDLLGEQLSVAWHTFTAEQASMYDLVSKMGNCRYVFHHNVGRCARTNATGVADLAFFDIPGVRVSLSTLAPDNDETVEKVSFTTGLHAFTLEQLALSQVFGTTGSSANRVLQIANSDSTKIYLATKANWSSDVLPNLTGYTISPSEIYDFELTWDHVALVAEDGGQDIGSSMTADGYIAFYPTGGAIGRIYSYKGGTTPWKKPSPPPEKPKGPCEEADPVGLLAGDYRYRQNHLNVGSADYPYRLNFGTEYSSGSQYRNGPLGLGWQHNWMHSARQSSDGFKGFGMDSPIEAVATIVEFFACLDLISDDFEILNMVTAVLGNSWWSAQLNNNILSVGTANKSLSFVRLPDGTFTAPNDEASTLEEDTGEYILTSPEMVVSTFNTDGNLETITFPYGVTISLSYSSGKLQTVDNGMGRVLNFTYTGDKLTSVDDDNSRTIEFAYDGDELSVITDPLGEDVTFEYDQPGQLTSYFLPENPTEPMVVNSYDSLGRISSQLDVNGHEQFFYIAGWRTEFKNVLGHSSIYQFDQFGNIVKKIDELGFETNFVFDQLGRMVEQLFPEGNRILWTHDSKNNILTETHRAKPESNLEDIVLTSTWDSTYNKITSEEDGRGALTTYTYDVITGNLLLVERPIVGGETPMVALQYNERGQLLSKIDESGMQTQFVYDDTTEVMTSRVMNTNWTATVGGTSSVSDVLSITVTDAAIVGGSKVKSYTVLTGDGTCQ